MGHTPLARADAAGRHGRARPLSHRQALGAGTAGRRGKRPHCRDRGLCHRRRRRARLWGHDAAQSLALSRARPRLCLSRLRPFLDAECVERGEGNRRRRARSGRSSRSKASRSCGKIGATERLRDLARGPGRLAQALRIDRSLDGLDLCRKGPLWLARDDREPGEIGESEIGESVRIGISREADRVLRFYVRGSPFVSGAKSLNE